MNIEIKKYVEEYYIDNYLTGYVKGIRSREEYINSLNEDNNDCVLIRFFDREVLTLDNKRYYSKPINFSSFIKLENNENYSTDNLLNSRTSVYDEKENEKPVIIKEIDSLSNYKEVLFGKTKQLRKTNR